MRIRFSLGLCIALLFFADVVHAAAQTPVSVFVNNARFAMSICEMKAKTNAMSGKVDFTCGNEQKETIKPSYAAAAKSLAKNNPALGMLKDLYAYWIVTMTSISPTADELKTQYGKRMQEREAGVNERINRLLLEIGEL